MQESTKTLAEFIAPVDTEPEGLVDNTPLGPTREQLEAFVAFQVMVELPPLGTARGSALMERFETGAFTVTSTLPSAEPVGPVQCTLKIVLLDTGTVTDPLGALPVAKLVPVHEVA